MSAVLPPPACALASVDADDQALSGFTQWQIDDQGRRLARSQFRLSGLHCAACAGLIEQALHGQPGVVQAQVNGASERLSLLWDPAQVNLAQLQAAVAAAGYDAAPDLSAPARAQRKRAHRQAMWQLFVAGFLMMQVMMLAWPSYVAAPGELLQDQRQLLNWGQWVLTLPAMLLAAGPFFKAAWKQLLARRPAMDVPITLGLLVAFIASTGATLDPSGPFGHEVFYDSITMFLSFLLGARYLELRARQRAALALEQGAEQLPDQVQRLSSADADATAQWVAPHQLRKGDWVRVPAGQAFPADARVVRGSSAADEALLSGEARPQPKAEGDMVLAGSVNLHSPLLVEVQKIGEGTRQAGIQRLMREALTSRPQTSRLADRMATPFTWAVLLMAGLAALAWQFIDPTRSVAVAVAVLIVTCPCALSLAAPSAWLASAGALARRGVQLSRLDALETMAQIDAVVVDKTGTLTDERMRAQCCWQHPQSDDKALALALALDLAQQSSHPRAQSLAQLERPASLLAEPVQSWVKVQELPGKGLLGEDAQGQAWRLGAPGWAGDAAHLPQEAQLALSCNGKVLMAWAFDEGLRPDAAAAMQALAQQGLQVQLLSGDTPSRVEQMARACGLEAWSAQQSPEDKLAKVRALQAQGLRVLMVGDGVNDAPVLAQADVSMVMGQGADLARMRADAVLFSGRLLDVVNALQQARATRRVIRQNLAWAAAYNATSVPLALVGWMPPWAAGLGMALSSILVMANAWRLGQMPMGTGPAATDGAAAQEQLWK
ncbi:heavy metal translocating P-type ATPase [Roseateles sp. BYS180W]|uniref:Heavy metal translocating P-type ATPase n=1 Tax=Roseateles rivi TaxID=3299028 RepID=A0ABW7FYQ5_9BURK